MAVRKQSLCFLSILGFAALYVGFGFLFALDKRDTSNVLHEIFREKALAANRAVGKKRILLTGGSNVVWGFRSQLIEDATGIPTFNLALIHEAYDPKAMRALTQSVVRKGDVVVYSSISFLNSRGTDPNAAQELLQVAGLDHETRGPFQRLKRTLCHHWSPYPQRSAIIASLPTLYRRYIQQERSIHAQGLNAKGDVASCHKQAAAGAAGYVDPPDRASLFNELQEFQNALRAEGASLVLQLPPTLIVPDQKQLWLDAYIPFLAAMREQFAVATQDMEHVVSTEEPRFCDSGFHLGNEEAENRSRALAAFLNSRQLNF
ncbi:hypothetical protein [Oligoflexus tunisiensis]|uniref:hypothetical protein n=1 Tax=Oligoflexus tunisiensis TaxID=708132 RepID=UPI00114D3763|nr:hypothetical protein [Oligoflexus tunisiensis]